MSCTNGLAPPCWKYSPALSVQAAHGIPHVYQNGQMAANTNFNLSAGFAANALMGNSGYVPSLLTVPAVLLALGVITLIITNVMFFLRCCCRCLSCGPTEEMVETDPLKVVKKRKFLWYSFLFWVFVVILADHAIFFGNADFDKAIDNGANSFGKLKTMFAGIYNSTNVMSKSLDSYNLNVAYSGPTCTTSLQSAANGAKSPLSTVQDLVKGLPDQLGVLQSSLGQDAKNYKNNIFYILYAVVIVMAIAYPLVAYFLRSKCLFIIMMLVSEIVIFVYTFLCAFVMFFVMIMGDFCMNPSNNLVTAIPNSLGSSKQMLTYYITCSGKSPFDSSIETITNQLGSMSLANTGTAQCPGANALWPTTYTNAAQSALNSVSAQLNSMKAGLACGSGANVNMAWDDAMNKAVCTDFFNGLFKIWVAQYVVSGALFFTVICASVLYQYFPGQFWNLKSTGEIERAEGDEENPSVQVPEYELSHGDFDDAHVATAAK